MEKDTEKQNIELIEAELKKMQDNVMPPIINDSPESIMKELFSTEKEIAGQALNLMRRRYDNDKNNWERLFSEKEREILALKSRLEDAQQKIKEMNDRYSQESQSQLDRMQISAKELEFKKRLDKEKWEKIASELKGFKDYADNAHQKFLEEQERLRRAKKQFADNQKQLNDLLNEREKQISKVQEELNKKEEIWLKDRSNYEEQRHLLNGEVDSLRKFLDSEKTVGQKNIESERSRQEELKRLYENLMAQHRLTQEKNDELTKMADVQKKQVDEILEENQKLKKSTEQMKFEWHRLWQEEHVKWDKYKREFVEREEILKNETEQQIQRTLKSLDILEQQLTQEQAARKDAETLLLNKDQEVVRLVNQRDELVDEWKKVIFDEQQAFKRRYSEVVSEFERVKRLKEDETVKLYKQLANQQAELSETKRLLEISSNETKENRSKITRLEEDKKRLEDHIDAHEQQWRKVIENERDFAKKQLSQMQESLQVQLSSRDEDIKRLNDTIRQMDTDLIEARNSFYQEKQKNQEQADFKARFDSEIKAVKESKDNELARQRDLIEELNEKIRLKTDEMFKNDEKVNEHGNKYVEAVSSLKEELEALKMRFVEVDSQRSAAVSEINSQKSSFTEKIESLIQKNDSVNAALDRAQQDLSRKEQMARLEGDRNVAIVRAELEKVKNQLAKEVMSHQAAVGAMKIKIESEINDKQSLTEKYESEIKQLKAAAHSEKKNK